MPPASDERRIGPKPAFDLALWDEPFAEETDALIPDMWEDFAPPEELSLHERRTAPPPEGATPLQASYLEAFEGGDEGVGSEPTGASSRSGADVWQSPTAQVPPVMTAATLLEEAHVKLARGNYAAALVLAEQALALEPEDFEAEHCVQRCHQHLRALYVARIGDLTQVPNLRMTMAELCELSLDARAFFLLSRIDGQLTLEELIDISGMQELEAMRYLHEFLLMDVITMN